MLFCFFSIFLICISFTSCEVDHEVIRNSKQENNEISFEEFKKETGLKNFNKKIHIKKSDANTSPARLANGNYELSDFNISTEIIKKLDKNGQKSYTFRIVPIIQDATQNSRSIFNLALFKKGDQWETSIIEFIPTVENFNRINEGLTEKVEGDAKIWYQGDLNNYASVPPVAMKQVTVEIIIFVCEGCPVNGPCDYYSPAGCSSTDSNHQCGPRSFYGSIGGGSFGPSGPAGPGAGPGSGSGPGGGSPSYGGTSPTTPFEPTPPLPIDWSAYAGSTTVPGNTIPSPVNPLIANVKGLDDDFEDEKDDPCEQLKEKEKDSVFKAKMTELKGKSSSQNFESAYVMYQVAGVGTSFSAEQTGTAEKQEVKISLGGTQTQSPLNVTSVLHNHLDNGTTFKVFSFSDIIVLGEIAKASTRPTPEFAIYVSTSSGTFAIKVNNKILLKSKLELLKAGQKAFEVDYNTKVKMTDSIEIQKLGFLQFINNMQFIGNPGIDLYENNNSTGKWKKLTLSSNGKNVVENPCN